MITDFSKRKFTECEYRIKYDIRDCTECDIAFECEQHDNSFDEWEEEEFDVFDAIANYFMPANVAKTEKLPC